jgi:hypothetical protein
MKAANVGEASVACASVLSLEGAVDAKGVSTDVLLCSVDGMSAEA